MSTGNLHLMQVLWDNVLLILAGMGSWVLTLGGVYDATKGILTLVALLASIGVSLATLYKISKELGKKNGRH